MPSFFGADFGDLRLRRLGLRRAGLRFGPFRPPAFRAFVFAGLDFRIFFGFAAGFFFFAMVTAGFCCWGQTKGAPPTPGRQC